MAMYYCHHCGNYIDDDWHPGEEDPTSAYDLICPDCLERLQEEAEEELHSEDYRTPRVPFDKHQRLVMRPQREQLNTGNSTTQEQEE